MRLNFNSLSQDNKTKIINICDALRNYDHYNRDAGQVISLEKQLFRVL